MNSKKHEQMLEEYKDLMERVNDLDIFKTQGECENNLEEIIQSKNDWLFEKVEKISGEMKEVGKKIDSIDVEKE